MVGDDATRVATFVNDEGTHEVSQDGDVFYHRTSRVPRKGDPVSVDYKGGKTVVRAAKISRDGGNVSYEIQFGAPTPASTLERVSAALPADMRRKKFVIKKVPGAI
jgi:hypothetical protein